MLGFARAVRVPTRPLGYEVGLRGVSTRGEARGRASVSSASVARDVLISNLPRGGARLISGPTLFRRRKGIEVRCLWQTGAQLAESQCVFHESRPRLAIVARHMSSA